MNTELREWLNAQLAEAEKSVKARQQLEDSYRQDEEAMWERLKSLPGTTVSTSAPQGYKHPTKAQRLEEAEKHKRIGDKCRKDVQMWKTVIALLEEKV